MTSFAETIDLLEQAGYLDLIPQAERQACRAALIARQDLLLEETGRFWCFDAEALYEQGVHVLAEDMLPAIRLLGVPPPKYETRVEAERVLYRIGDETRSLPLNPKNGRLIASQAGLQCLQAYLAGHGIREQIHWELSGDYVEIVLATATQWELIRCASVPLRFSQWSCEADGTGTLE